MTGRHRGVVFDAHHGAREDSVPRGACHREWLARILVGFVAVDPNLATPALSCAGTAA
jgi:hypothetical protein